MKRKDFNEKMQTLDLLMSDYRKATVKEINEKWPSRLEVIARIAIDLANEILRF